MVDSLKKEFPSHRRRPTLIVNRANDITVAENPEELAMRAAREKMASQDSYTHSDEEALVDTLDPSTATPRSRNPSGESAISIGGIVSNTYDQVFSPSSVPTFGSPLAPSPVEPIPFPKYDSIPRHEVDDEFEKSQPDYENVKPTIPLDQTIKEEAQARHHLFTLHAKSTRGSSAHNGVAKLGSELAKEVEEYFTTTVFPVLRQYLAEIRAERGARYTRVKERQFRIHFSFVGHGLGGLVAKYASGLLLCGPGTKGRYEVPPGDNFPLDAGFDVLPSTPSSPYAATAMSNGTQTGILGRLVRENSDLIAFLLPTSYISVRLLHGTNPQRLRCLTSV